MKLKNMLFKPQGNAGASAPQATATPAQPAPTEPVNQAPTAPVD